MIQCERKYEAAKEVERYASKRYEKMLGLEHPHTLINLDSIVFLPGNYGKRKIVDEVY